MLTELEAKINEILDRGGDILEVVQMTNRMISDLDLGSGFKFGLALAKRQKLGRGYEEVEYVLCGGSLIIVGENGQVDISSFPEEKDSWWEILSGEEVKVLHGKKFNSSAVRDVVLVTSRSLTSILSKEEIREIINGNRGSKYKLAQSLVETARKREWRKNGMVSNSYTVVIL